MDFQNRLKTYINDHYQQVIKEEEKRMMTRYAGTHFFEENVREMIKKEDFVSIRVTEELKKRLEEASKFTNQDKSKLIRKSILAMLDYVEKEKKRKIHMDS